jgi:rhodanese-related sulfurtransferase
MGGIVRLALCAILLLVGSVVPTAAQGHTSAKSTPAVMSAREAHAKALAGELLLVDIRSTAEWRKTGVPASGHALTMHQDQAAFMRQLAEATAGSRQKPIALICASGSRSAYLQGRLKQAGFAHVIDVAEGMVGGRLGSGWIASGLPLRRWAPGLERPQSAAN